MGLAGIENAVARAVGDDLPGVVAGVARGADVHVFTAGRTAFDGPPMRRDTQFRIASISKPITAAVVLSLVEDGVLDLDEPVARLLPELDDRQVLRDPAGPLDDTIAADRPVTVRDLLTFTWGFGMQGVMFFAQPQWPVHAATVERDLHTFGEPMPASMPDQDTWIARLGQLPLMVQPGERWLYQTGSQVLGVLVSRAGGAPFQDVLRSRLFDPLGMRDTGFHATDPTRLATLYSTGRKGLVVHDPPGGQWARPPSFQDGGGGMVSTVDDLLAFGMMLARGGDPVLAADTVAEMTRNQLTDAQRSVWQPGFDILGGQGWGFGLSVSEQRYGWDGGFGTAWSNVPSLGLTVVVLTQRSWNENGPPQVCADVLAEAIDEYRDEAPGSQA